MGNGKEAGDNSEVQIGEGGQLEGRQVATGRFGIDLVDTDLKGVKGRLPGGKVSPEIVALRAELGLHIISSELGLGFRPSVVVLQDLPPMDITDTAFFADTAGRLVDTLSELFREIRERTAINVGAEGKGKGSVVFKPRSVEDLAAQIQAERPDDDPETISMAIAEVCARMLARDLEVLERKECLADLGGTGATIDDCSSMKIDQSKDWTAVIKAEVLAALDAEGNKKA